VSVDVVAPGDRVTTRRSGDWLVKAVGPVGAPENTMSGVTDDLIEDTDEWPPGRDFE
jgi:hypothetical protein